ncbi:MAG: deoxyribose-phosphate aldolase [Clostridia bacterium]|nr:deoxyribose-phosphate aldolase [Clostridia bacterium]
MNKQEILKKVDHTVLTQTAKWEEVKKICDDGIKYNTASVCIPPSYVEQAKKYVGEKLKICTVIGFPNGYNTSNVKVYETLEAIEKGADEIDMVINIGWLKDKKYEEIENEIKAIKNVCGDKILKVIIETCLLTDEEKVKMCEIVDKSGADRLRNK